MPSTNTSLDLGQNLLLRNSLTGQNAIWLMNGTSLSVETYTSPVPDANWSLAGAGDFNHDGNSDLVWRNQATGEDLIWLMNGTSLVTSVSTTAVADLNWQIAGVGDFNRDGNSDLVWRNKATGEDVIWLMNGTAMATAVFTNAVPDLNWQIAGTGDFNHDGNSDLVWRNQATGENIIWLMNGTAPATGVFTNAVPDLNWHLQAIGDFNNDGNSDLVWRNQVTGQNIIWLMNGTTPATGLFTDPKLDQNWQIVGSGNFGERAKTAYSFIDSIGVNTHLRYYDTPYGNFSLIDQSLLALGIHHIRDGGSDPTWIQAINTLASQGIRSDIVIDPTIGIGPNASYGIAPPGYTITQLLQQLPSAVEAVEILNEFDLNYLNGYSYNGQRVTDLNWVSYLRSFTQDTYSAIASNPATSNIAIIGPSFVYPNSSAAVGNLSQWVTYGNLHPYNNPNQPEGSNLRRDIANRSQPFGSRSLIATEEGYPTGGANAVSTAVQAKYISRMFLENFDEGITRTYAYELIDEKANSANSEDHFGLLNADGSPKPAFTALQNLIRVLNDASSTAASFTPGTLTYSLSGNTQNVEHTLLQKSNGDFELVLWLGVPSTDQTVTQSVTVNFATPIAQAVAYLPNQSIAPAAQYTTPTTLTLNVPDYPTGHSTYTEAMSGFKFMLNQMAIAINDQTINIPILAGMSCNLSEVWMISLLERLLQGKAGVFLDVGVNLGQTLIKVKAIAPQMPYVGFEPNPACVFYVKELIKLNQFADCTIVPIGLFTEDTILSLDCIYDNQADSAASLIKDFRPDRTVYHTMLVPVFSFQTITQALTLAPISLVKIDVEGAELDVVKSLYQTLCEQRPIVLLEVLPVYSSSNTMRQERQEALEQLFKQLNYVFFRVVKTAADAFVELKAIDAIGIHADLTQCDYVVVPKEDVETLNK